jgi:hypothetical protein
MKSLLLPATACVAAMLCSAGALANSADLAMSNDTVEASYRTGIGNGISALGSWLHHEDDINIVSAGIYAGGRQDRAGAFVGARAFWLDADGPDGYGIAIGGALSYELVPRLTVEANLHYAPRVTSYRDIDNYQEWGARLTFQLLQSANVFAGFRDINVDVETAGDRTTEIDVVRGGYVGFTLYF